MDDATAAVQLETLSRLLKADGWGEQYIEACIIGADGLRELNGES